MLQQMQSIVVSGRKSMDGGLATDAQSHLVIRIMRMQNLSDESAATETRQLDQYVNAR